MRKTSSTGFDLTALSDDERVAFAATLTPDQRHVLLAHGTEAPFCGGLLDNKKDGIYACALCGLPLFSSQHKFDSGTGWPSYQQPFDGEHVREIRDVSHGMIRTEVRCARCDGHLGHVFLDGPPPSFTRYCLNSEALEFFPHGDQPEQRVAAG